MTTTQTFCAGRQHSHCTAGHPMHRNDLPAEPTTLAQRWSHCRTVDLVFCDLPPVFAVNAAQAADLIRQLADRTGPLAGDPFDADLWMAEAAALLGALIP